MTYWRDSLLPAQFAGVPFFVEGVTTTLGRRVPVIRFAGRSGSALQDLGQDSTEFALDAFVVGDNYHEQRNALVLALTQQGPADIQIPTWGKYTVRVIRGPVVAESKSQGGFAKITFTCITENLEDFVLPTATSKTLASAATSLTTAILQDHADSADYALPSNYLTSTLVVLGNISTALNKVQGTINGYLNPLQDLSAQLDQLTSQAEGLLQTPSALASSFVSITQTIFDSSKVVTTNPLTGLPTVVLSPYQKSQRVRAVNQAMRITAALGTSITDPLEASTRLDAQEIANNRALNRLIRASALASLATAYSESTFDSSTLALESLKQVRTEIDALQSYSPTDALYDALSDLRSRVVDHLVQVAQNLPQVVVYTQRPAIPALVLAHMYYGDATRESEIIERNRPKYPGFLSGDLELLNA